MKELFVYNDARIEILKYTYIYRFCSLLYLSVMGKKQKISSRLLASLFYSFFCFQQFVDSQLHQSQRSLCFLMWKIRFWCHSKRSNNRGLASNCLFCQFPRRVFLILSTAKVFIIAAVDKTKCLPFSISIFGYMSFLKIILFFKKSKTPHNHKHFIHFDFLFMNDVNEFNVRYFQIIGKSSIFIFDLSAVRYNRMISKPSISFNFSIAFQFGVSLEIIYKCIWYIKCSIWCTTYLLFSQMWMHLCIDVTWKSMVK